MMRIALYFARKSLFFNQDLKILSILQEHSLTMYSAYRATIRRVRLWATEDLASRNALSAAPNTIVGRLPSHVGNPSLIDPRPHGVVVLAKQVGDFLYRIAAVNFDQSGMRLFSWTDLRR